MKIVRSLALLAALFGSPALAQQSVPYFPQTINSGTVVGRLSSGPGPTEAIPFASLLTGLFPVGSAANPIGASLVGFQGSVSGAVTVQAQPAAGTWTLQWPTVPGATGDCLSETVSGSVATAAWIPCAIIPIGNITGLGTGVATALGFNTGTSGGFVVNGGAGGTPSSLTLTSATGLPISTGLTGAGTGVLSALSSSANGTGSMALSASPAFTGTPLAPTASPGTNTTQIASTAFVEAAVTASTTGVASVNGATGAIVGVDTSTINTEAGSYSIASTDCGKVIYATGGQNTITLPSPSGFPAACTVTVKNGEVYSGIGTARAKILAGFPSDLQTRLWPLQSTTVKIEGSSWITTYNPGRWILPTSAEICVAQNGNDANDGLAAGSGCMQTPQAAIVVIGNQWDGGGYNSCAIGFYTGGTNTLAGNVSQTGQSVGCFITVNVRGAITWASTGACWTGGDNSITIINANLGFTPTLACNTSAAATNGQFKCHQYCVYDINGTFIWLPQGSNVDQFFYADLQASATINVTVNIGDGVNTFAPLTFAQCAAHCSKLTLSGSVGFSAHVTMGVALALSSGSVITTNLTWPGGVITSPSTPTGNSVLITNGTTIPGGTSTGTGGQVCTTAC
jgi:hypothetical protein